MRIIIFCSLLALCNCSNNDSRQPKSNTDMPPAEETKKIQTAEDIALQEWMQGKVWKAEESMAPMRLMKLKADGESDDYKGRPMGKWSIVKSELVLSKLTEWPVKKVNDSTLGLYVKPSDTWYLYKRTEDFKTR